MLDNLVNAIGSMAEMAALFYTQLVGRGVPSNVAETLTCAFVQKMVPSIDRSNNFEED